MTTPVTTRKKRAARKTIIPPNVPVRIMTRSTTSKKRKNVSYNSNNDAHITQSITNVLDKSTATIETVITKKAPDPTPELNKMSSNATTLTEDITFNPLAIEASTGPPIISTPPSIDMPMTPDEIMKWKASYTEENLKLYFMGKSTDRNQQMNTFGTLAKLMIASQTVQTFNEELNKLYRWQARYTLDIGCGNGFHVNQLHQLANGRSHDDTEERLQSQEQNLLPSGWRLYLQLISKDEKWLDWIYLAKSNFASASIGVFAAKNFQKGGIIGFYVGNEMWKAPVPGTQQPTDENRKSHNIQDNLYSSRFSRNNDAIIRLLHQPPFELGNPQLLYMGMHFLNNACLTYNKDSPAYNKARKLHNCKYIIDGTIITSAKVSPGQELLSGYNTQQDKPMTKCRNYPHQPKNLK
jgi:hypothetical protein